MDIFNYQEGLIRMMNSTYGSYGSIFTDIDAPSSVKMNAMKARLYLSMNPSLTLDDINNMTDIERLRHISLCPSLINIICNPTELDNYVSAIFSNNLIILESESNFETDIKESRIHEYNSIIALENPMIMKYLPKYFHTQELQLQCMKSPYFRLNNYNTAIEPNNEIYECLTEILHRDDIILFDDNDLSFKNNWCYINQYIQWIIDNNINNLSKDQFKRIVSIYNSTAFKTGLTIEDLIVISDKYKLWYSEYI